MPQTALITLAVLLELRGDIWDRDGRTIFIIMDSEGRLTRKARFYLRNPPPTCEEDGIDLDLEDDITAERINELVEQKKGNLPSLLTNTGG